jgi:3-isopropylmalate dehydrogenase
MKICVLPGDGIGVEVIEATLPILQKVQKAFSLEFETYPAGAQHYKKTGDALPEKTFEAARDADAMLIGYDTNKYARIIKAAGIRLD